MSSAPPDGRAAFAAAFDVSRETLAKLDRYAELLAEWQARYNLVGPATLADVWTRHFADSAQLAAMAPRHSRWLDIGSGGGFPGMVVALLTGDSVCLVDSVRKKTAFLEAVRDELGLGGCVEVRTDRVESMASGKFDVITARACAPLAKLFDWGLRHAAQSTIWLLPKGASVGDEIAEARRRFDFAHELIESQTDRRGRIVKAWNVRRRSKGRGRS
jgi:16S rRNA (guanine527-N7)-methyltransferase